MSIIYQPYRLIRSDRRTISIEVAADGEVIVRAPKRLPIEKIEDFIGKKYQWICEHVATAKGNGEKIPELASGKTVAIIGKEYRIEIVDCKYAFIDNKTMFLPENGTKIAFKRLIAGLFLPYITDKTHELAAQYGLKFSSVRLSSAKKRWASCSSQKTIRYNLALAFLPEHVCLSVVAHELCHTVFMNHGKRFYALLYKIMPDYEETVVVRKQYSALCAYFSEV